MLEHTENRIIPQCVLEFNMWMIKRLQENEERGEYTGYELGWSSRSSHDAFEELESHVENVRAILRIDKESTEEITTGRKRRLHDFCADVANLAMIIAWQYGETIDES